MLNTYVISGDYVMGTANWSKIEGENAWTHSSNKFIIAIDNGGGIGYWDSHIYTSDWEGLGTPTMYYPTKKDIMIQLYAIMKLLSKLEDLNKLITINEFFWKMILDKCIQKKLTLSQYLESDDAKCYDLFRS